jgi:hypothetical protein
MVQDWHNDDYLILFEEQSEAANMAGLYGLANYLPGYLFVGIKGWDNFIVCTAAKQFFTIPTLPIKLQYLKPFEFAIDVAKIRSDERLAGKIKWYIKPVVFGGDPSADSNIAWLSIDQHAGAIKWWNQLYFDTVRNNPSA